MMQGSLNACGSNNTKRKILTPNTSGKWKKTSTNWNNPSHGSLNACSSNGKEKKRKIDSILKPCSSNIYRIRRHTKDTDDADVRNWLDLPRDVMVVIFQKLGIVLMLTDAQLVCTLWRDIAKDPVFYHHILLRGGQNADDEDPLLPSVDATEFALLAVDRSCGQLIRFSCKDTLPFRKEHLHYIANSSTSSMKSLRLAYCINNTIKRGDLVEVVKKIPSLEDLQLADFFSSGAVKEIGRCCPKLKYLRLENMSYKPKPPSEEMAFEIAESMPNLCRLHLSNLCQHGLTRIGLQAILEGCPRLNYLYLSQRFSIDLEFDLLKKRVRRLQKVKSTYEEPFYEYEFHFEVLDDQSSQIYNYEVDFFNNYQPEVYVEYDSDEFEFG